MSEQLFMNMTRRVGGGRVGGRLRPVADACVGIIAPAAAPTEVRAVHAPPSRPNRVGMGRSPERFRKTKRIATALVIPQGTQDGGPVALTGVCDLGPRCSPAPPGCGRRLSDRRRR